MEIFLDYPLTNRNILLKYILVQLEIPTVGAQ